MTDWYPPVEGPGAGGRIRLVRPFRTGQWVTVEAATRLSVLLLGALDRTVEEATRDQLRDAATAAQNAINMARASAKEW